jgi:hypothetical protein
VYVCSSLHLFTSPGSHRTNLGRRPMGRSPHLRRQAQRHPRRGQRQVRWRRRRVAAGWRAWGVVEYDGDGRGSRRKFFPHISAYIQPDAMMTLTRFSSSSSKSLPPMARYALRTSVSTLIFSGLYVEVSLLPLHPVTNPNDDIAHKQAAEAHSASPSLQLSSPRHQ